MKASPRTSSGTRIWRGGNPQGAQARTSLSEVSRPTAISAPTSEPKGKDSATTQGSE